MQLMLDTGRLNPSVPIDITQLVNSGVIKVDNRQEHGGIMLEEEVSIAMQLLLRILCPSIH